MVINYLHRLYDTVISRGYIEIEQLIFNYASNRRGSIIGQLKFYDGSFLEFGEVLIMRDRQIEKVRYPYHYQSESGELIFRYDNAPHYPNLSTHPHHKHIGLTVAPTEAPDLSNVLHEIEQLIFE